MRFSLFRPSAPHDLLNALWKAWQHFRRVAAQPGYEELTRAGKAHLDAAADAWRRKHAEECVAASRGLAQWSAKIPAKSIWAHLLDLGNSLLFAAIGALLIRSAWFELYHVPTGSMRPTIHELDRLVVSKTAFGLNRPLGSTPLFFDPHLLERGQIVTFTSFGLDMQGKTRPFGRKMAT